MKPRKRKKSFFERPTQVIFLIKKEDGTYRCRGGIAFKNYVISMHSGHVYTAGNIIIEETYEDDWVNCEGFITDYSDKLGKYEMVKKEDQA